MKLYKVTRTFYVMAKDEENAATFEPHDASGCTNEAEEALTCDTDWWNALPFGEQIVEKTCGQIVSELNKTRFK